MHWRTGLLRVQTLMPEHLHIVGPNARVAPLEHTHFCLFLSSLLRRVYTITSNRDLELVIIRACWCTAVIPALEKLRQEDHEFKINLR